MNNGTDRTIPFFGAVDVEEKQQILSGTPGYYPCEEQIVVPAEENEYGYRVYFGDDGGIGSGEGNDQDGDRRTKLSSQTRINKIDGINGHIFDIRPSAEYSA